MLVTICLISRFLISSFASIFGLTVQLIRVSSDLVALGILRTNSAEFRSFIRDGLLCLKVALQCN